MQKLHALKLRTKLALLILISGTFCVFLFLFFWKNIGNVWNIVKDYPPFAWGEEELVEILREESKNYELPKYDQGKNNIEYMGDFFTHADDYTGVFIYGAQDGLYRAGKSPRILDNLILGTFLEWGTSLSDTYSNPYNHGYDMEFQNMTATVYIRSYHNVRFVYPYIILISVGCVLLFLSTILLYINRKIKNIRQLNDEILLMASGDLNHPIACCGQDEIGSLSLGLDKLRTALSENIEKESQSRKANQDLITAMSHDLRTPLTILKGYLEVFKLKRNQPELTEIYLERCLKKTDEIQEMTDRMFEYALVFEENEDILPAKIPLTFLWQCLKENMDFLQLAGFSFSESPNLPAGFLMGDKIMIKRIFNNLFSNILKYGDKSVPVHLSVRCQNAPGFQGMENTGESLVITLKNHIRLDDSVVASNGIGLKSVGKMAELHQGTLHQEETDGIYSVELTLPVKQSPRQMA